MSNKSASFLNESGPKLGFLLGWFGEQRLKLLRKRSVRDHVVASEFAALLRELLFCVSTVRNDRDFPLLEGIDDYRKLLCIESETDYCRLAFRDRAGPILGAFVTQGSKCLLDAAAPNQVVFYDENAHQLHSTR